MLAALPEQISRLEFHGQSINIEPHRKAKKAGTGINCPSALKRTSAKIWGRLQRARASCWLVRSSYRTADVGRGKERWALRRRRERRRSRSL